jgi:hypothetical protein
MSDLRELRRILLPRTPVNSLGTARIGGWLLRTCATLPLGRGKHSKLMRELLGYAAIAIALNNYSHYLPSRGDQAAGAMGGALVKSPGGCQT